MKKLVYYLVVTLALIVSACNIVGQEGTPMPDLGLSPSVVIDPTTISGTTQNLHPVTITLTQQSGNGPVQTSTYTITSNVSWYGSTTTWTYTVTADASAKNISHVNFFGFDNCFWDNISTNEGLALQKEPAATSCTGVDMDVIKYTPANSAEQRALTFTWTFNKAIAINESAASLFVKAGTQCKSVSIPGPACDELKIAGVVTEKYCVDSQTTERPYAGVTVNAAQGTTVLSTTTDSNGAYSFSNLGGEWVISVAGADDQKVVAGPDNGSASFLIDTRPNSSCAVIVGTAKVIECFEQSPLTKAYAGATATCEHTSCTSDSGGSFKFSNAIVTTHSVTVDGVTKSVAVTSENGVFDAGEFVVDKTNGGVCGKTEVVCSLSQGYWFAKPQAVWPNGTVTLGGKTYTQAEGKAIWNTTNRGGLLNAKAAFTQAAAIKLSKVKPSAAVWADVQIIENYLATIAKLNPASLPANTKTGPNAAAGAAAGRIGNWINSNHCAE